jgi:hypothetical protein
MEGTLEMAGHKFWWNQIADFVKHYIQGCHVGARNKHQNQKPAGLLQPLHVPEGPWLWTQSDFIMQLLQSEGHDSIYIIID